MSLADRGFEGTTYAHNSDSPPPNSLPRLIPEIKTLPATTAWSNSGVLKLGV